jgi:hypothetical protein
MSEGFDYFWRMVKLHPERRGQACRVHNRTHSEPGEGTHFAFDKVAVEFEDGFRVENVHRSGVRRIPKPKTKPAVEGAEENG